MKHLYSGFKSIMLVALVLVLSVNLANAGTCTSIATGNWSSSSTWSCGHVPSSTDDVVIAAGTVVTLDANYTTVGTATLTINGEVYVPGNQNITLSSFSSVVVNCTGANNGEMYFQGNATLKLPTGTSIVINSYSSSYECGFQPVGGTGSAVVQVGNTKVAVESTTANNADYSFGEFNGAGGLPSFILSGSSPACYSSGFTVTMTPTVSGSPVSNYQYYCIFALSVGSGTISPSGKNLTTGAATATIAPSGSITSQTTYTVQCKVFKNTDQTANLATLTFDVSVDPATVAGSLPTVSTICSPGATGSLTLSGNTGSVVRWESSTDNSTWSTISNTTTSQSYTAATQTTYYRTLVKSGTCASAYTSSVPIGVHNYWAGTTSTDWSTSSNWSDKQVPSFGTCPTATIPAVSTLPQLSSSTTVTNLIIASGANLDLNGKALEIDGTFSGSSTGYLKGSSSSSLTIGANDVTSVATGTLYFDAANNYLNAFKIRGAKSVTLGNALNIDAGTYASPGTLTATGTLTTGGYLTLKSNSSGDARIASSTGSISGNVTVERYIPARRAWRFLAIPFASSSQTINQAWQEGYTNTTLACPVQYPGTAGYGTEITYNGVNGYDLNVTTNPSIKVYTSGAWAYLSGTNNTNIAAYPAYCLFVRGDRQICLSSGTSATPSSTVLRATGSLNETGATTYTKSFSGSPNQWVFAGNPFASSIDLTKLLDGTRGSGFSLNKMWVWDPKLGGNYGVGAYVTFTSGVWAPVTGSSTGSYPSGTGNLPIIQSGQAFMVQLTSASSTATFNFQQSDKSSSESNINGLQAGNSQTSSDNANSLKQPTNQNNQRERKTGPHHPVVYANLMVPSGDSLYVGDGVAAVFSDALAQTASERNAAKNWNTVFNMSLVRNGQNFAIEFRPRPRVTDTLFFRFYLYKDSAYAIQIFSENISDSLKGKTWLVDKYLNTQTEVNLAETSTINFRTNQDTNSYRNRFMLVYVKNPDDGQQTVSTAKNAKTNVSYISMFPNPATNHTCNIQVGDNLAAGKYQILIYDDKGMLKLSKEVQYDGHKSDYKLALPGYFNQGVYKLTLSKNSVPVQTISFILSD